jgi:hypothetical protein
MTSANCLKSTPFIGSIEPCDSRQGMNVTGIA